MKKTLLAASVALALAACGGGGSDAPSTGSNSSATGNSGASAGIQNPAGGLGSSTGAGTANSPGSTAQTPAGSGASGGGSTVSGPGPTPEQPGTGTEPISSASLVAQPAVMANTTTAGDQTLRSVGARSDGGHTVAWLSGNATLHLQHFDAAGQRTGPEVVVVFTGHSDPAADPVANTARVAVLADGGVVVAYQVTTLEQQPNNYPLQNSGIYVQRFDARGAQVQAQATVTQAYAQYPYYGSAAVIQDVVALADGGFAVGWGLSGRFSALPLYHQRFGANGQPVGDRAAIETFVYGNLGLDLAPDAQGGYTASVKSVRYAADGTRTDQVSVAHHAADGTVRQVIPVRDGAALLVPLSGSRYVLFASNNGATVRQLLNADGSAAGEAVPTDVLPSEAHELGDGSFVASWSGGGNVTVQRFDRDAAVQGEALRLPNAGATTHQAARLRTTPGIALGWSAAGTDGEDVYTQRVLAGR